MKVNSEKFKSVFNTVCSIAEKTKTGFTELVKISVNKGVCKLESASAELMVVGKLRVVSGNNFETCVNASNLIAFVRPIKAEEFEIALNNSVLQVIIGSVIHSLDTANVETFPVAPKFNEIAKYTGLKDFNRIGKIANIPDAESDKPMTRAIYFSAKSETSQGDVVGCDNVRIGRLLLRTGIDKSFAVPKKAGVILSTMDKEVDVILGDKYVKFTCAKNNIICYSDVIPIEKYINYERKISAKYPYSMKVIKKSIVNAVSQILLSSDKEKNCIAFKVIDKETVTLRTFNSAKEIGSQATLDVTTDLPKGFITGFNGKMLLEMINECEEDYITFNIRSSEKDRRFLMDTKDVAIILMNINLIEGLGEEVPKEEENTEIKENEEVSVPVENIPELPENKETVKEEIHQFGKKDEPVEVIAEEIKQEEIPVESKEVAEVLA